MNCGRRDVGCMTYMLGAMVCIERREMDTKEKNINRKRDVGLTKDREWVGAEEGEERDAKKGD